MAVPNALSTKLIRAFVVAAHGNLPTVREMLAEHPGLLDAGWQWAENDWETAIQAAVQVGNAQVAEYLLEHGAPLEICTAAALGRIDDVRRILDNDPNLIKACGSHGITLMAHAALSGNVELAQLLYDRGAREGMSYALGNAVMKSDAKMARWLIENGQPDMSWKNYEGRSLLALAGQTGNEELAAMLRDHGAP